jgi:hypothetical protein
VRADGGVLAYTRGGAFLVALNLTAEARELKDAPDGEIVLGEAERVAGALRLPADGAAIVRLAA